MHLKLTGYFKFLPIKEFRVKAPTRSLAEATFRYAVGHRLEHLYSRDRDRDFFNTVFSACAGLGWYNNGGWKPNGTGRARCSEKDRGDILGVCATFDLYSSTRVWLYCDRKFEEEMTKCFVEPDDVIRSPFTVQNCLLDMKHIPDQKWLDAFCEATHSPDDFARKRNFSRDDAEKLAMERPDLAAYVKLMWRV